MENAELTKCLKSLDDMQCYKCSNSIDCSLALHAFKLAADALEAADKRVKELEEAQRWISVKERVPTGSEYRNGDKFKSMDSNELVPFLVCCEDTEIPFRAFYDGKNWGDGWGKQNVTHWRKLPQPPQERMINNERTSRT